MSEIKLKSVAVENFGGIANGTYFFNPNADSVVAGKSGNGKSTCYNAYLWALGFNVQGWETLINGYRLHKKDTKVEIVLLDNDTQLEYKITKTSKPRYSVDKFTGEEQFKGNEYKYFIDDMELPQKEFAGRIEKIFSIDNLTLELLSNTKMFNSEESTRWNKDLRRKFLLDLFEKQISDKMQDVTNDEQIAPIKEFLLKGYDEFQIAESIKTLKSANKKSIDEINGVLNEKERDLQNFKGLDFEQLLSEKLRLENEIKAHSEKENSTQTSEIATLEAELAEIDKKLLENKMSQIECEMTKQQLDNKFDIAVSNIEHLKSVIASNEAKIKELKEIEFDKTNNVCAYCGQAFSADYMANAEKHFNEERDSKIRKIIEVDNKKLDEELDKEMDSRDNTYKMIEDVALTYDKLKAELLNLDKQEVELTAQLNALKSKSSTENHEIVNSLMNELVTVTGQLAKQDLYLATVNRIEELKMKLRELGMQESEIIAKKQALNRYNDIKNKLIDECMKNDFVRVRYNFKQWLKTQNGKDYDENYKPICTCTLDDIEYDSLSSGQQVVADILTSLSLRKILGAKIPQFIDDVVLASIIVKKTYNDKEFEFIENYENENGWQKIYLVTDDEEINHLNIYDTNKKYDKNAHSVQNIKTIKDVYTMQDCDIR